MRNDLASYEDLPLLPCVECGTLGYAPDDDDAPLCFECRDYQQGRAALDLAPTRKNPWDRRLVRLIEGSIGCLVFLALAIGPVLVH
jgi:hypothetical protein